MILNNYCYFIKLYISITTSRSLALSTGVLFISLIQSVNGAHILNINSLFFLPASIAAASVVTGSPVIVLANNRYV